MCGVAAERQFFIYVLFYLGIWKCLIKEGCRIIKNIIFDIGNVLLEWEPEKYLRGLYDINKVNKLMDLVYGSKHWQDADKGGVKFSALNNLLCEEHPDWTNELGQLISREAMMTILIPKQETIDFMYEMKNAGYKIYLLSNFPEECFSWVDEAYKFLSDVDGRVISAHVNLSKPDPKIYELILEKYGLEPSETVFTDDMAVNVQAAKDAGINAIQFTDFASFRTQFDELLTRA